MRKIVVVLFVFALGVIVPAYGLDAVRVNIPFDFIVRDTTLPAGEYSIAVITEYGVAQIRNLDGGNGVFALTGATQRMSLPEIVTLWTPGVSSGNRNNSLSKNNFPTGVDVGYTVGFNKYGDQYFISHIWTGLSGREFHVCRAEQAVRTAGLSRNRETVILAAANR